MTGRFGVDASRLGDSLRRLLAVARKEVRQLPRDPLTLGFVVFVPLVQLALFGYAINQDVREVPTAVLDRSQSAVSRHLVDRLEATQALRVTRERGDRGRGRAAARRGSGAGGGRDPAGLRPPLVPRPRRRGLDAGRRHRPAGGARGAHGGGRAWRREVAAALRGGGRRDGAAASIRAWWCART